MSEEKIQKHQSSNIFENMVLGQGYWFAHDYTTINESWEVKPFMVGKNPYGRRR